MLAGFSLPTGWLLLLLVAAAVVGHPARYCQAQDQALSGQFSLARVFFSTALPRASASFLELAVFTPAGRKFRDAPLSLEIEILRFG